MVDIESVIKNLNKNMKIGTVQLGVEFQETPKLPFSSPRLNYMTYGGVPLGRVAEFSGPDGSGKTTTALDLVGQAQKMFPDKVAAFVDVEHTFDSFSTCTQDFSFHEIRIQIRPIGRRRFILRECSHSHQCENT